MNLDYKEFYLLSKSESGKIRGTLHFQIKYYHITIDIRGMHVIGDVDGDLRFVFPSKTVFDLETRKEVSFPVVDFSRVLKENLLDQLQKEAGKFISERLENPKYIKKVEYKQRKPPKRFNKKPFKKKFNKFNTSKKPKKLWTFNKKRRTF